MITVTGWFSRQDPPCLSALGTGKGVLAIEGANTAISLTNIGIIGGRAAAGAGLFVTEATVTLDNGVTFKDNVATDAGGAIYAQNAGVTLKNAVIGGSGGDANSAKSGGGVYVKSSILDMKGGRIEGNRGGGVFASESVTTLSGGTITGNLADTMGGGLYIRDGEYTLSGGTLAGNVALKGAAVYLESSNAAVSSRFTMKGGDITRHASTAVFIDGYGSFVLSGGTITRNGSAFSEGGAVALSGAKFTMTGGEISGNEAGDGGGVFLQGFTPPDAGEKVSALFDLKNGQIKANRARRGGGVFTGLGSFAQIGGVINGNSADDGGGVYSGSDLLNCRISEGAVISGNKAQARGGGFFVAAGEHFAKQGGGTIFGGTPEDIRAWADLTNSAGDGVSHAVFFATPEKTVAQTVPNTEDLAG
jgi:predicted outer membrane repeat protein